MTQESINDLIREAASKIAAIFGDTPTAHVFPAGVRINIETGETSTITPRKGSYKIPSESFFDLHSEIVNGMYQLKVESIINEGLNKDLLLIDLREEWIKHQRATENLSFQIRELEYIVRENPDKLITTEGYEKELTACQYDQIREQMFADFYRKVITELETGKETKLKRKGDSGSQLTHKQQMVLLAKLGFLEAHIFEGLTTENKAVIIGNLLNRNIQDTRKFLTYYKGKIDKDHPRTPENEKVVEALLLSTGLPEPNKEK